MGDYIKREDAMIVMRHHFDFIGEAEIADIPSADVEQIRHGYWKIVNEEMGFTSKECSECGCEGNFHMKYCPHCGAKMD